MSKLAGKAGTAYIGGQKLEVKDWSYASTERKPRPQSKTLRDAIKVANDKSLDYRGRQPIPYLGHKQVRQNPAIRAWAAGVACHKDWKPASGKLSIEWLYETFYVRETAAERLKKQMDGDYQHHHTQQWQAKAKGVAA